MDQANTNGLDKASAVKVITSTNAPNSETKIGIDLTEQNFLGKKRLIYNVFEILRCLFLSSCLIFAAVLCALYFHNTKIERNQEVSVVKTATRSVTSKGTSLIKDTTFQATTYEPRTVPSEAMVPVLKKIEF